MGGDSGGAAIGVAALGLDAPDRQHRLASHVHAVTTHREREERRLRESELPRAEEQDPVRDALLGERAVHAREPELEGQRDMVGERERSCSRAALPSVDGDEVDAAVAARHECRQVVEEVVVAHRALDADRQPGLLREELHEVEERISVVERRVRRRTDAVLAHRDAAHRARSRG